MSMVWLITLKRLLEYVLHTREKSNDQILDWMVSQPNGSKKKNIWIIYSDVIGNKQMK